jgi:hypothetical protein
MRRMLEVLAALAIAAAVGLMLVGCDSGLTYEVSGEWRLNPPPVHFEALFDENAACILPLKSSRQFDEIAFYSVSGISVNRPHGAILGATAQSGIWIKRPEELGSMVPQHEMLHVQIPGRGHEDPVFERCDPFAQ